MALVPTEEQILLQDSVRALLAEQAPIAALRKLRDTHDARGFSADLWKAFGDMGFAGVLVPEALGGSGLGLQEAGIIMEAMGRNLVASPFFATSVLGATALRLAGSARADSLLAKIARADILLALALDERARHQPYHIATSAMRAGEGYVINGEKIFVVDGHVADCLIVVARTSGEANSVEGLTLFLVDAKAEGVGVERTIMADAHNSARLTFHNVVVSAADILGQANDGYALLQGILDAGAATLAAELLGVGDEAFDRTIAYLKERKQFGQTIGAFQGLQHRAAHLYGELEVSRSAVLKALQILDDGQAGKASALASLAKARASTTANLAVQEAVQMHGGIGMTDAIDIGLFMKRCRVLQELLGDERFHADRLARLQGY